MDQDEKNWFDLLSIATIVTIATITLVREESR